MEDPQEEEAAEAEDPHHQEDQLPQEDHHLDRLQQYNPSNKDKEDA